MFSWRLPITSAKASFQSRAHWGMARPPHNLYGGTAFAVRAFFHNSADWKEVLRVQNPYKGVLERVAFQHRTHHVVLVADAYQGSEIKQALTGFFQTAAGVNVHMGEPKGCVGGGSACCSPDDADLVVYVGHDGLIDFSLPLEFPNPTGASKSFFKDLLHKTGAEPLLWTTGLMTPEAYALKAAMDGWVLGETTEQIRERAAEAYSKYQKCGRGLTAFLRFLVSAGGLPGASGACAELTLLG